MPYCDNIHSISSDKSSCNEGKQRIVSELAGQGFTIHEEEDASTLFNTLGGVVDGDSGRVGMTSRRAWDLIHAFEYVAEHVVSREVVQKLLGHAMFFLNNQPWWNECFFAVYMILWSIAKFLED